MQAWGSSMLLQQRIETDAIAAHIASTASLALSAMSQSLESSNDSQAGAVALHLAALKVLLASILSPVPHRPPFLAQALDLFTQVHCSSEFVQMMFA